MSTNKYINIYYLVNNFDEYFNTSNITDKFYRNMLKILFCILQNYIDAINLSLYNIYQLVNYNLVPFSLEKLNFKFLSLKCSNLSIKFEFVAFQSNLTFLSNGC